MASASTPRLSFWTIDNANKFLQVQAVAVRGVRDGSLAWAGRALDPTFAFDPLPYAFSQVHEGKLYSVFSPVFAVLSALPYRLGGMTALYALPLLAALLALACASRLIRQLGGGPASGHAVIWLAGVGTPFWFYAVELLGAHASRGTVPPRAHVRSARPQEPRARRVGGRRRSGHVRRVALTFIVTGTLRYTTNAQRTEA